MNYYDELLDSIRNYIENNDLKSAKSLIDEELRMPYIPENVEEELLNLQKIILSNNTSLKAISDEELIAYLCGDREEQLIAANILAQKNLRDYIDIIEDYFKREDGFDNAKVYIVSLLIEQEIGHEFHLIKNGIHYEFIPRYLYKLDELDSFKEVVSLIEKNYSNNPSLMNLMIEELIRKMFEYLPLQYEDFEGEILFEEVERHVLDAFNKEI